MLHSEVSLNDPAWSKSIENNFEYITDIKVDKCIYDMVYSILTTVCLESVGWLLNAPDSPP